MRQLTKIEELLRDKSSFFNDVHQKSDYGQLARDLVWIYLLLTAFYGVVMGSFWGWGDGYWRFAVADVIKIPLLFIATLIVCLPALYVSNVLLGTRLAFGPMVMLWLGALTVSSVMLAATAPIVIFFMISSRDYSFIMLLHVAAFAISGLYGVSYLASGVRHIAALANPDHQPSSSLAILRAWLIVYAFVGTQMAWIFRPYVGGPDLQFQAVRPLGGNFYTNLGYLVKDVFTEEQPHKK
jgi:hypothetical protein